MEHRPRKSRSRVLFDFEDLLILKFLKEKRSMTFIRKNTKMSHNALKIHIDRLKETGLIEINRGEGKDYKTKYATITEEGIKVKEIFSKPNIQSFLVSTILVSLSITDNLPKDLKKEVEELMHNKKESKNKSPK